ncbi:TonB-dependent receptor [Pseudoduganella umbonata]|uniref:Iron complex outermembrane receptor protein n=1 Tax=Pseudoduganella umbonata TaxID=864828 RepID=A0A7W5EB80_9BURK|nr:TonB-dependent receptor [Pseudoduganella umbonata]MBB3222019.1 iron complex outermembrane receptor protein [Pseudoduganella umbonata]
MIKPFNRTAIALALLAAYAGSAHANPLVAAVAAAPSGVALAFAETDSGAAAVDATAAAVANAADAAAAPEAQATAAGASAESFVGAVQTVLVTTRRRVESSQSVPTPMTVLGDDVLEGSRIYRVQDLQQLLPSTTINYVHARQLSFAVRGLGNNPASDGLEGSVGIYLDNVYLARPGMAAFDALDVQQLELLRGPQGTLFGKNTTAGVLNISTKKPTFAPERSVELSGGQFGYVQGKVSLSGPVTEQVAARFSAYKTHDDGYITNRYNGKKVQGGDRQGVRGQVLYEPSREFSLRVIADYNEENSNNGTLVFFNAGPSGRAIAQAALVGTTPVLDPTARAVNLDTGSSVTVHQGGVSAEANWTFANDAKLTSITAWRRWNFVPQNDDGLPVPVTLNVGASANHKQFTQELRWSTPSGRAVESVFGGYYYYQELSNNSFTVNGPLADIYNGNPAGAWANVNSTAPGELRVNSYALFGQSTWHATGKLDLTAGVRASYEDKWARVIRNAPTGGAAVTGAALGARNGRYGAFDSGDLSLTQSSPTALLSAGYKLTPDVLLYGSLSHGEKSGGINLAVPGAGGVASMLVGAERANALELGVKSTVLDNRLQLNGNLFATIVHGYQSNAYDPISRTSYLTNAGDVRTRGIEVEAIATPFRGLTLRANGSFNDASYLRYTNAPCAPERAGVFCDLSGRNALVNAPRWIGNLRAQYSRAVAEGLQGYVNGNYAYRGTTYGTLDASEYAKIPSYSVSNLSVGVRSTRGAAWDVSLWVKNAFDKHYYTSLWNSGFGSYNAVIGTPRTAGITGRYEF